MAYDLEEQEQIDELKAWWNRHGNTVIGLVTAGLIALAGYKGWTYYQHSQAVQASAKYETLTQLDAKDIKGMRTLVGELMDNYSGTPYAGRAALIAAKANYAANDAKSARAQLEWATSNAKEDSVRAIAQLQLAGLQYEEKQYDAALKTLEQKHDAAFDGLYADLKGDVLTAQGKKVEAKAAYELALSKLDSAGRYHRYTQYKLDALGS